jgi:hypothetical protein
MVMPCTCCNVDLANEYIVALVTRFKEIDKNDACIAEIFSDWWYIEHA